ncbi:hypothetical protein BDN67DRAFT_1004556 [Paxillus ammoniavirescens]|nr:hypothetical protein BDN67DRAFT_1004556 [Paxillus ammoniavirescens]
MAKLRESCTDMINRSNAALSSDGEGDDGDNHGHDDDAGYTQDGRMSSETPELHSDAVSDGEGDENHESGSESESANNSEDDSEELKEAEPQKVPVAEPAEPADPAPLRRSNRPATQKNTQETSQSSLKRQAQADSESHASKRAKTEEPKSNVTVQTALYAAEMQSASIAAKHIFNFIVIGDGIWFWFYDHQGLISVGGVNFVRDLPRFLVLLYALPRFNSEDWGRNTAFTPKLQGNDVTSYTVDVHGNELTLDNTRATRFGLAGRGTDVMDATREKLKLEKAAEETEGEMVAKIYWGEEARVSEEDILQNVMKVAENHVVVRGHVPVLLLAKKFPVSTFTVRKALGLENLERGSRTLFLLLSKKLSPIKELQGDDLLNAWRECVLCHYVLWKSGIYHRDVSCESLMYHRVNGKVVGVLNDHDLASLAGSDNPLGNEPTGTMLFMAIDLLDAGGQDGKVKHLYRHDMESFVWVFVWICHQFKDGKLRTRRPLDAWAKADARRCVLEKSNVLIAIPPEDVAHMRLVLRVVHFLKVQLHDRYNSKQELALAQRELTEGSTAADLMQRIETLNTNLRIRNGDWLRYHAIAISSISQNYGGLTLSRRRGGGLAIVTRSNM